MIKGRGNKDLWGGGSSDFCWPLMVETNHTLGCSFPKVGIQSHAALPLCSFAHPTQWHHGVGVSKGIGHPAHPPSFFRSGSPGTATNPAHTSPSHIPKTQAVSGVI